MDPLPRSWFHADAVELAPQLLNRVLIVGDCAGRIIEVEAYTADDPASHSHGGPTDRNRAMFGPPGHLYVYLIYGVHHCANVVTGSEGDGQAVLIRAIEPMSGIDLMRARRGDVPAAELTDGPGKLCRALDIDRRLDGADLVGGLSAVQLADDGVAPPDRPLVGPRVGITKAVDRPWRWRVPSRASSTRGGERRRAARDGVAPRGARHG